MGIYKQFKDHIIRIMLGKDAVPSGLFELQKYFRNQGPIHFRYEQQEDGSFVALSEDFRYGKIITHAESKEKLEQKIPDAILTAFEVPSSYAKEAGVHRVQVQNGGYAFA